jgi:hypothetical protein
MPSKFSKIVIYLSPEWIAKRAHPDDAESDRLNAQEVKEVLKICDAARWATRSNTTVEVRDADGELLYTPQGDEGVDGDDKCDSCNDRGWVHIDLQSGIPDGVYNCDCDMGLGQTHDEVMKRHKRDCGCKKYGLPKTDKERENAWKKKLQNSQKKKSTSKKRSTRSTR